jgi:hypothetical protein
MEAGWQRGDFHEANMGLLGPCVRGHRYLGLWKRSRKQSPASIHHHQPNSERPADSVRRHGHILGAANDSESAPGVLEH